MRIEHVKVKRFRSTISSLLFLPMPQHQLFVHKNMCKHQDIKGGAYFDLGVAR